MDINIIMPLACEWAAEQELSICRGGLSLTEELLAIAQKVGVQCPDKIRIAVVNAVPVPAHPLLQAACASTGLITSNTIGLTLRYGIFIRQDESRCKRLFAHEFAHVAQYERLGGVQQFLTQYLAEVLNYGYPRAPMEQEAIRAEMFA